MHEVCSSLSAIDWDFPNVRNEGLASFHWYPATFVAAIPGSIIPVLSKQGDLVADPFCGTSTTGLEAVRLGRQYLGIDLNPVAHLIGRARLSFPRIVDLQKLLAELQADLFNGLTIENEGRDKELELLEWYHPITYSELRFILRTLRGKRSSPTVTVGMAVFSSILKNCSSQGRHWGWVCDNVKPKRDEIVYKDATQSFTKVLGEVSDWFKMLEKDMRARGTWESLGALRTKSTILCDDSIKALSRLSDKSINLILTSPPYYGVADYTKSQRLSFLWLEQELSGNTKHQSLEEIRLSETGARSKRHRKSSFAEYFNYMRRFFSEAERKLEDNGYMCLVIGESESRQEVIDALDAAAKSSGFVCLFNSPRQIRKTRRRLMAKVATEKIIVYAKE